MVRSNEEHTTMISEKNRDWIERLFKRYYMPFKNKKRIFGDFSDDSVWNELSDEDKNTLYDTFAKKQLDSQTSDKQLHTLIAEAIALKTRMPELLPDAILKLSIELGRRIKVYCWADDKVKELYVYDDGIYTTNGKCTLEKELQKILDEIGRAHV